MHAWMKRNLFPTRLFPTLALAVALLAAGTIFVPAAFAAPSGSCPAPLGLKLDRPAEMPIVRSFDDDQAALDRLVFVALPPSGGADRTVSVRVESDGETLARESLQVPAGDGAVELFAYQPQVLDDLHRLAATGADLVATVDVDGFSQQFDWSELTAESRRVKLAADFEPLATEWVEPLGEESGELSRVTGASQAACYQQCAAAYDACDANCDPWGSGPGTCTWCYQQLQQCQDYCDDCPYVGQTTTTQPVQYTALGPNSCRYDDRAGGSHSLQRYDLYQIRVKQTVTRVTQNCDGSITHQVISVTYTNHNCWYDTNFSCLHWDGNASWLSCVFH